jgi:DNA topoisomerase-1
LLYVADSEHGITRKCRRRGFHYFGVKGKAIRDPRTLRRIRSLVIPPAWTDVWICTSPHGHIQATGRDARGRKQYLYHPRWNETRDETKYGRMIVFGKALPLIRRQVKKDLGLPDLSRTKVLAAVIRLFELTGIRVGNPEYVRLNGSFGLTTLRDRSRSLCRSRKASSSPATTA